jgi:hypothetical protein
MVSMSNLFTFPGAEARLLSWVRTLKPARENAVCKWVRQGVRSMVAALIKTTGVFIVREIVQCHCVDASPKSKQIPGEMGRV